MHPTTPHVVVRNYQGPVPDGAWSCSDCAHECDTLEAAASHSDARSHWLWLFEPDARHATFEVHPSDHGGVYLNTYPSGYMTYERLSASRAASARARLG